MGGSGLIRRNENPLTADLKNSCDVRQCVGYEGQRIVIINMTKSKGRRSSWCKDVQLTASLLGAQ